jgi:3-isopropylmalate/(R)-2-methylmalate dehydratase large subunit
MLRVEGSLPSGVTPKDLILFIIGEIGVSGAAGHVIEYTGDCIPGLTMEGRMTVCNMSIEAGARAGMIAPDDITFAYLKGRRLAQVGSAFEAALEQWQSLCSEPGATFDHSVTIDARGVSPMVTWGTTPGMVTSITESVPDPTSIEDSDERDAAVRALEYMGLEPGTRMEDLRLDRVFIGSCTNGRIEDLREVAAVLDGRHVASNVAAMVVPGSAAVKRQAEDEGIAAVIESAGFEWREAGCSMCLGMNPDRLEPGERCASTSNRNFEGRQGPAGRTHLVSPPMAAAAAVAGHFVDVRDWAQRSGRNQA